MSERTLYPEMEAQAQEQGSHGAKTYDREQPRDEDGTPILRFDNSLSMDRAQARKHEENMADMIDRERQSLRDEYIKLHGPVNLCDPEERKPMEARINGILQKMVLAAHNGGEIPQNIKEKLNMA
ncbi:hypothetical protein Dalk_5234 [Desulfatibacillum aliphaticivorans]|uniref:Uncharacterized protein n=1 Tax=Desulfatibacillum aliphaticivorans TaxID=218208 RepID=B8FEC3_DESAL|nr:hypothetical protein [Desulfatibacillum aliphaticivorans]ACL06904.1 hypothetical protein Dalk_5234 [Desulfatibacillum aliphaticivorans]